MGDTGRDGPWEDILRHAIREHAGGAWAVVIAGNEHFSDVAGTIRSRLADLGPCVELEPAGRILIKRIDLAPEVPAEKQPAG